jgi:beta-glucanase (GH16 family)
MGRVLAVWVGVWGLFFWSVSVALAAPPGNAGDWSVVFADEFNSTSLDTTKWTPYHYWAETSAGNAVGPVLSWFTPNNISQSGGILHLTLKRETVTQLGKTYKYTSAVVSTGGAPALSPAIPQKFIFQYGYTELRAKLLSGKGVYSNYWLLDYQPADAFEIDAFEVLGQNPLNIPITYWDLRSGDVSRYLNYNNGTDFSAGYHTYGVDWTANYIVFYIDDREVFRVNEPNIIANKPMYVILDAGVGGSYFSPPDETAPFPDKSFEVDYLRVYQRGTAPLKGDFDGDGDRDFLDARSLMKNYGLSNSTYNLVGTSLIDVFDFNKLLSWL